MSQRSVPRNIDKPNRTVEYMFAFLIPYYAIQFMMQKPLMSFGLGFLSVYLIYKLTLNKPEGMAYRLAYKYVKFGKMIPNPKKAPKFELRCNSRVIRR